MKLSRKSKSDRACSWRRAADLTQVCGSSDLRRNSIPPRVLEGRRLPAWCEGEIILSTDNPSEASSSSWFTAAPGPSHSWSTGCRAGEECVLILESTWDAGSGFMSSCKSESCQRAAARSCLRRKERARCWDTGIVTTAGWEPRLPACRVQQ